MRVKYRLPCVSTDEGIEGDKEVRLLHSEWVAFAEWAPPVCSHGRSGSSTSIRFTIVWTRDLHVFSSPGS